jgi:hypothetical protein
MGQVNGREAASSSVWIWPFLFFPQKATVRKVMTDEAKVTQAEFISERCPDDDPNCTECRKKYRRELAEIKARFE